VGFNFIDIIILLVAAMFIFRSYRKGFTGEVFGILALIVAFAVSLKLNPILTKYAKGVIENDKTASILVFAIVFIVLNIVIRKIGVSIRKFLDAIYLGWMDSLAGAALGAIKAVIICIVLLFGLRLTPFGNFGKAIESSKIAPQIEKISGSLLIVLKKNFPKELNRQFFRENRITRTFFSN